MIRTTTEVKQAADWYLEAAMIYHRASMIQLSLNEYDSDMLNDESYAAEQEAQLLLSRDTIPVEVYTEARKQLYFAKHKLREAKRDRKNAEALARSRALLNE